MKKCGTNYHQKHRKENVADFYLHTHREANSNHLNYHMSKENQNRTNAVRRWENQQKHLMHCGDKIATIVDTFHQGSFCDTEPNMISRANPSN